MNRPKILQVKLPIQAYWRKEKTAHLLSCANSAPCETTILDKGSKYNLLQVDHYPIIRAACIRADFSIVHFWYNMKPQLHNIHAIAARIFATPISSTANERTFSALKLLVSEQPPHSGTSIVENMILVFFSYKLIIRNQLRI